MYQIQFSEPFRKLLIKVIKTNPKLQKAIIKTIELLRQNPKHPSLHSHKVDTIKNKNIWSSRITGDWRIGWIFDEKAGIATIICLELGTHSGANQIYN